MPACPQPLIDFAGALADAAGDVIRPYFRTPIAVEDKPDESPVTVADRETEAAIRSMIRDRHPDHGIIGEEHGSERADARHVWVIDPIDGTKSFISGLPLFGTLIALLEDGVPILGVIDQPILRERWLGARGRGTTLNGAPVRTRSCPSLAQAALFSTTPDMFAGDHAVRYERLRESVRLARFGGDCYAAGLLASGFVDLHVEGSMQPYDYLALVPVVEGAGGVITDWAGAPLGLDSDGFTLAAGDPVLHRAAMARLAPPA
jgi:inositol-phosphate phosphatase/L-galactose 1-phosphate phosphatase/histidinol-phosphatase